MNKKNVLLSAVVSAVVFLSLIFDVRAVTAYVAENGNDGSAVLDDRDHPFKSIQSAVTALGADGGTVSVGAGTYAETGEGTCVVISAPVEVVGATGNAADVTVTRGAQKANIFKLDHPSAKIRFLTVTGGLHTGAGARVSPLGGTIEDCIFDSNKVDDWSYVGGIYMEAGRASRIVVRNHTTHGHSNIRGVGIYLMGDAVCEDSLFYKNTVSANGTVYMKDRAVLRNCTVADNFGTAGSVGVWADSTKCQVENCLIYGNWSWGLIESSLKKPQAEVYRNKGAQFVNCVADAEIPSSTGCSVISVDPFVDRENGDYRITAALRERPSVGFKPVPTEVFSADFRIGAVTALVDSPLVFEAGACGMSGAVTYAWDFGDGSSEPAAAAADVSHAFKSAGSYTVTLTANDGVHEVSASHSVRIGDAEIEVASGGDIQAAVDAAVPGTVIRLATGTYRPPATLSIAKGVTIVGEEGAEKTVLDGQQTRSVVFMDDFDAVIRNVTITGGKADLGAGVRIGTSGGTLEGCIITNNIHKDYGTRGTGVYMENGRVQRCVVARNSAQGHDQSYAPGVYISAGQVLNTLIAENTNCKVGGAVRVVTSNVRIVNCTIVANSGTAYPGVYFDKDAASACLVNCAIFGNVGTGTEVGKVCGGTLSSANVQFVNCACACDVSVGTDWQVGDALFVDAGHSNYRLGGSGSVCFDAGCDPSSYVTLGDLDLDGNPRAVDAIDIGCFEDQKDQLTFDFTVSADRNILPAVITFSPHLDGSDDPYTVDWFASNTVSGVVSSFPGTDEACTWSGAGSGIYAFWGVAHVGAADIPSPIHDGDAGIRLSARDLYVLPANDDSAWPYDTPETAATNIADAVRVAADGATVHVLPGETSLHYRYEQVDLLRAITVQGEAPNRGVMITNAVNSGVRRFFKFGHPDAKVANLTFAGGYAFGDHGANFDFAAAGGTVSNCLIRSGHAYDYNGVGAVAFMIDGGLITHCEITGEFCARAHHTDPSSESAILICCKGKGRVQDCFIHDLTFANAGVTYYNAGPLVHVKFADNLTIVNADIPDTNWGATSMLGGCGIHPLVNEGTIRNCVVANVRSQHFDALRPFAVGNNKTGCFVNCAGDAEPMNATCLQATPEQMFKDPERGNYTPKTKGALYDAGAELADLAPATDVVGNPRIFGRAIDIGAFESQQTVGLMLIVR